MKAGGVVGSFRLGKVLECLRLFSSRFPLAASEMQQRGTHVSADWS